VRDQAGLEITPERNQELARHGQDGDAPDAALHGADPLAQLDAQGAVGLVAQPKPGELDHGFARLGIAFCCARPNLFFDPR
jgi:hypothetical protein